MLLKNNYRYLFIFTFLILICSIFYILSITNKSIFEGNITSISQNNIETKLQRQKNLISKYFQNYESLLLALGKNAQLQEFINKKTNLKGLEQVFYTSKNSLGDISSLRLMDLQGKEIIRVDSHLIEKNKLQNKAHRYYFHRFKNLEEGKIGFSNFDLQKDNGKIIFPKIPNLRMATLLFDKNKNKKYMIVMNISLEHFFEDLKKTTLYHVYLVDNKKRFILHPEENRGLLSESYNTYLFKNEFSMENEKNVFSRGEFLGNGLYSLKLDKFNNTQDLRIVLKSKFDYLKKQREKELNKFYLLFIVFIFVLFLAINYYSKLPEKLRERINKELLTNRITGLSNRDQFLANIEKLDIKYSIVLININNYQSILNVYEYKIANEFINLLSTKLEEEVEKQFKAQLYSINDNTFAFILRNNVSRELKNLHKSFEKKTICLEKRGIELSPDITIALSSYLKEKAMKKFNDVRILLDTAIKDKIDLLNHSAKLEEIIQERKKNLDMAYSIKKAIDNHFVEVHFQPIFNNYQKRIEKYECLMRLRLEDKLVSPNDFLEISKNINKYKELTKILILNSFEYFKTRDYEFSINLTIEDINDKDLVTFLIENIKKYKIGNRLVLELVESDAISDYQAFIDFIINIKKYGCKIAIDDFGSGYSNFEYIIKLSEHIDYLKIDGSLIKDIQKDRKAQLLVGTIKFLCDNLQIRTIAEYISDKEVYDFISSMGISYSQGYYIGKPDNKIQ